MPIWAYPALFAAGLVAGILNVIAGGGSFLTLPILLFLGLPAPMANGTNRVSLLFQNVGAVWAFKKHDVMDWDEAKRAAIFATLGALLGVWMVFQVDDHTFKRILAFLMIAVTLVTLLSGKKGKGGEELIRRRIPVWATSLGYFLVGIYGGFVQAGIGFFMLVITTLSGFDLVRGNAIKVFCILVFTVVVLGVFISQGAINWGLGLCMAAGSIIGAQIGVRLAVTRGHGWVRMVVTVAVIGFAVKLWIG
jgi:uncharacterized membrane protein YfcA